MSLLKCGDCGNDVSDQALACPKCGRPTKAAPSAAPAATQGEGVAILKPSINFPSIVSGIVQLLIAAWLQFSFLPAHDPANVNVLKVLGRELQGEQTWVLSSGGYLAVEIVTIALALNALLRLTVYSRKGKKLKSS